MKQDQDTLQNRIQTLPSPSSREQKQAAPTKSRQEGTLQTKPRPIPSQNDCLHDPEDHCLIVRDLLPLYAENLASAPSCRFVCAHLQHCPDCTKQLEALTQGEVKPDGLPDQTGEIPMEHALRKVNKTFHRHRTLLVLLGVLIVALLAGGGYMLSKTLPVSARDVDVSVTDWTEPSDQDNSISRLAFHIESPFGKMFGLRADKTGEGTYALHGSSFQFERGKPYTSTFVLDEPVERVTFNGEIIYEDDTVITEGCRQDIFYANGYAGDIKQMALASPSFPCIIQAETDDPRHCAWNFILQDETKDRLTLDKDEQYILRANAMYALALTPNLEVIRYCSPDGTPVLEIVRDQMIEKLSESGLKDSIDSYASLQKIMNALLPAAG